MEEIRHQMYNDFPNFANDDIFDSIYPKTKSTNEERVVPIGTLIYFLQNFFFFFFFLDIFSLIGCQVLYRLPRIETQISLDIYLAF